MGAYRLVRKLATGGMAEVFLAKVVGLDGFEKPVAVKRILPHLGEDPIFVGLFLQEAKLTVTLQHANVVQVFDLGAVRGQYYMVLEFIDGENLRSLLSAAAQRGVKVGLREACYITQQVAEGLAYAHERMDPSGRPLNVVHRDVNPTNVMINRTGEVKLADFGIAKPAGAHTSVGTLKGKVLYMAPEQLAGGPLDARSDLFALGIVLYETALGYKPIFDARDQEGVKRAVKERVVTPPTRVDPDFPPQLSGVIMKALERDPERRFQSGTEFADALGECLHHEAKGPHEYDLSAFMTRMYGEPQPLRGLSTPEPPSVGASPSQAGPELERVANDGEAATILRARASQLLDLPGAELATPQARPTIPAQPAFEQELWEKRKRRTTVKDRGLPRREKVQEAVELALAERGAEVEAAVPPPAGRPSTVPASVVAPRLRVGPVAKWVAAAAICAVAVMGLTWFGLSLKDPRAHTSLGSTPDHLEPRTDLKQQQPVPLLAPALLTLAASDQRSSQPPAQGTAVGPEAKPIQPGPLTEPESERTPVSPPAVDGRPALQALAVAPEARERERAPAPAAVPKPAPKSAAMAAAKPPQSRPAKKGTLIVHIRPWVHAWVDSEPFTGGLEQEAAPRLTRVLVAGRHVVHLRDFEGRQKRIEVVVPGDREVMIEGAFDQFSVR